MIHRQNYLDYKAFIKYQAEIEQKDTQTVRGFEIYIKHLLLWADDLPFPKAQEKDKPTFQNYLMTARNDIYWQPDKAGVPLALASQKKACDHARMFFTWAKGQYPSRYKDIKQHWINSLKPSRKAFRDGGQLKTIDAWTLEDVRKVASLSEENLEIPRLEGLELDALSKPGRYGRLDLALLRAQASICFLYLSGMRITAFLSLPVSCVDLDNMTITQDPARGVLTKFRKAATTSFLPLPELLEPVKRWDAIVRKDAPITRRWACNLNAWGTELQDDGAASSGNVAGKRQSFMGGFQRICKIADVPYKSPHKLRHGHAIYGVSHAKDIAQLKAVSQNLMHSSLTITDGVYGNLNASQTKQILAGLTDDISPKKESGIDLESLMKNPDFLAFVKLLKEQS